MPTISALGGIPAVYLALFQLVTFFNGMPGKPYLPIRMADKLASYARALRVGIGEHSRRSMACRKSLIHVHLQDRNAQTGGDIGHSLGCHPGKESIKTGANPSSATVPCDP